jgi:hypothetical protein
MKDLQSRKILYNELRTEIFPFDHERGMAGDYWPLTSLQRSARLLKLLPPVLRSDRKYRWVP